ncbi:small secreted protein [Hymenopellis radicata]|nr:small secreted protein [Hymenopellis radicata]
MPTPWEALLPFALVTVMFGAGGTLLNISQRAKNQWKPPRYDIDSWDAVMMKRDKLLTGHARGQVDDPIRPSGSNIAQQLGLLDDES